MNENTLDGDMLKIMLDPSDENTKPENLQDTLKKIKYLKIIDITSTKASFEYGPNNIIRALRISALDYIRKNMKSQSTISVYHDELSICSNDDTNKNFLEELSNAAAIYQKEICQTGNYHKQLQSFNIADLEKIIRKEDFPTTKENEKGEYSIIINSLKDVFEMRIISQPVRVWDGKEFSDYRRKEKAFKSNINKSLKKWLWAYD